MEYNKIIQNGGSKMADTSSSLLVLNNVIVTSLLLLKVIYMLANFLILTLYYLGFFCLMCTLREIWILPINSTFWRHNGLLCQSYAQKLEMMSALFCESLVAAAWAVFKI